MSLETSHDVAVGETLGAAAREVGHRSWFAVPHAKQHDPVQRRVRVPVPAARQPVACALSRRGGDGCSPGQGSERCLRRETLRVVTCRHEQRRSRERSDSTEGQKVRVQSTDEALELPVDRLYLFVEHGVAARQPLQRLSTGDLDPAPGPRGRHKPGAGPHPRQPGCAAAGHTGGESRSQPVRALRDSRTCEGSTTARERMHGIVEAVTGRGFDDFDNDVTMATRLVTATLQSWTA